MSPISDQDKIGRDLDKAIRNAKFAFGVTCVAIVIMLITLVVEVIR